MKILFLSTRQAKPSFRFRVEQFLPRLREAGLECEVGFLKSRPLSRFWLYRRLPEFDAIVIQKRLLNRAELSFVRMRAKRLIYDLDDAVMFNGQGQTEGRRLSRFRAMAAAADVVICGNSYLADQARAITSRVAVVPTCIDTDLFQPVQKPAVPSPFTIGWTGSRSTNRYLNPVLPAIAKLGPGVRFKFLSDTAEGVDLRLLGDVPAEFVPWSPAVEISETATFDVGLMPLPENPWTRGKCGFKALQYLGLGIPAVCSPVGVNREIITPHETGLLATTPEEWHTALHHLRTHPDLRKNLAIKGRKRVEANYSLNAQTPRLIELLTHPPKIRQTA